MRRMRRRDRSEGCRGDADVDADAECRHADSARWDQKNKKY